MYFFFDETTRDITTRHIMCYLSDGTIQSFPNSESNNGSEREAYLAWVAEGNTATEWSPEA